MHSGSCSLKLQKLTSNIAGTFCNQMFMVFFNYTFSFILFLLFSKFRVKVFDFEFKCVQLRNGFTQIFTFKGVHENKSSTNYMTNICVSYQNIRRCDSKRRMLLFLLFVTTAVYKRRQVFVQSFKVRETISSGR